MVRLCDVHRLFRSEGFGLFGLGLCVFHDMSCLSRSVLLDRLEGRQVWFGSLSVGMVSCSGFTGFHTLLAPGAEATVSV